MNVTKLTVAVQLQCFKTLPHTLLSSDDGSDCDRLLVCVSVSAEGSVQEASEAQKTVKEM